MFGACAFPTCPEGSGSGLSHQKYDNCPAGYSPVTSSTLKKGSGASEQGLCKSDKSTKCGGGTHDTTCTYGVVARPLKDKPYSISITDQTTGTVKTYDFNF